MPIDQADFVVSNITIPSVVDWTDVFQLSFTIKNLGLAAAGMSQIGYRFDGAPTYPGNSGTIAYSGGIAAQGSETFTVTVDSLGLTPGEHTIWVAADVLGWHNESDEINNLASVTFTVGPAVAKPDLIIGTGTVTTPPYVLKNGVLDFSYSVQNNGTGAAAGSVTYFKIDQQPTAGSYTTSQAAAGMDAGASQALSHSISVAGLSTGVHTLWLAADGANANAEKNEFNNWTSVTFNVMDDKPDLVVSSISLDSSNVVKGADLHFTYTVQNLGPKASNSGYILYDVSRTPDQYNNRGGWVVSDTLAYGESQTFTGSISTSGLTIGSHGLVIAVDATGLKAETVEYNNTNSIAFTVAAPPKPDHVIESITGPASVAQGGDLSFSYVVKDIGSGNAMGGSGYVIAAIDRQPTSSSYDYLFGTASLSPGASLTLDDVVQANLSVGEHTLWLKADGTGLVSEDNENNNLKSFTFTVTAPVPNPDLSIIATDSPYSVEQGFKLNFSYTVKNGGTLPSAISNVGFMVDQQADATHNLSAPTISALAAEGTQTLNGVIATSNLSVGWHTVWVAADIFGSVTEISEINNSRSFNILVREAQLHPDFVVESINGPLSVVKGATYDFSYVVKNIGTGSADSSLAAFVLDDMSSQPKALGIIDPLAVGATDTVTQSFYTSDLSVGQHTLYVLADWGATDTELDEANNWKAITFNVTAAPTAPDVTVKTLSINHSMLQQGERVNLSFTLENLGAGFGNIARTAYWIDDNAPRATWAYNMPPGDSEAGPYKGDFSTTDLSPGVHTLWVDADYFREVTESNETNNRASITFTIVAAPRPDLVVGSITAATTVAQGASFNFSYVIENIGTQSAGLNYASFRVDNQGYSTQQTVASLAAGASQTLSASIDTSALSVGEHTLVVGADGLDGIAEILETNNLRSVTFTVTAAGHPDLVVGNIQANASVVRGAVFDVSYVVTNAGTASAGVSWAALGVDQLPTQSDQAAIHAADALAAGGSQTLISTIDTSGLSVGQHTLWVAADFTGLVAEADETNNATSVTFTVTAPPRPDLEVASIAAAPSVLQGTKLDFSFVIENAGNAGAGSNWAGFRIDSQPDSTHADGYIAVGSLAADGTQTLNSSIDTSTLSVGTHTLYVMADYWNNQVAEGDETNNVRSVTFTVTAPPRPDLVVDSITAASTVVQGNLLDLSYVIKNAGAAGAGSSWAGFRIDSQPDSTHYDGFGAIGSLAAAGTQTLGGGIDTSKLSVGTHTLYVMADYWNNQVAEGDEGNNVRSVTFTVTAPVLPDLVVSSVTPSSTSVMQGAKLAFSFMVENTADSRPTAGSWAGFRIDSQPDSTHSDGYIAVGSLAADGTQTLSSSIDTSKLSVGTHTLYVMADYWNNQVAEGDETNNLASFTFTVTAPPRPDLVVDGITAGTSVMQGLAFDFSYVVKNNGTLPTGGMSWAGIMLDQLPDSTHFVGYNQTNGLAAGASQTLSNSIDTSKLSVGTHTLYVAADYWGNMVGEGNEANNWTSMTFDVTAPPRPDLIVSSITAGAPAAFDFYWDDRTVMAGVQLATAMLGAGPTSVVQGQKLAFSYFVANTVGDIGTAGSWAGFRIDGQPDDTHYDGFNFTEPLAGDGRQMLSNSIDTSTLSVGTHTLWVKADYWGDAVAESNETNNLTSFTFEVTARPQADLTVDDITAATSVMQGAAFTFSYVIENGGTAASGASWAGFMVDHAVDPAHYIGFGQTNALAVAGTQILTGAINTAGLGVGTHTLYVAADYWNNMVGEGNEANNVRSVTFEVTAPPRADLTVDSITPGGASVTKGDNFDFSYVIKNAGAVAAGANWAGFMIDQPVDQSHAVGFGMTNELSAGGTQTLNGSIATSGLNAGTHTLYVASDYWGNMVAEGNEANNALSITFTVVDPFA